LSIFFSFSFFFFSFFWVFQNFFVFHIMMTLSNFFRDPMENERRKL
jgi:hypothetical protein